MLSFCLPQMAILIEILFYSAFSPLLLFAFLGSVAELAC
jgi:hypothetical protein